MLLFVFFLRLSTSSIHSAASSMARLTIIGQNKLPVYMQNQKLSIHGLYIIFMQAQPRTAPTCKILNQW